MINGLLVRTSELYEIVGINICRVNYGKLMIRNDHHIPLHVRWGMFSISLPHIFASSPGLNRRVLPSGRPSSFSISVATATPLPVVSLYSEVAPPASDQRTSSGWPSHSRFHPRAPPLFSGSQPVRPPILIQTGPPRPTGDRSSEVSSCSSDPSPIVSSCSDLGVEKGAVRSGGKLGSASSQTPRLRPMGR